jgi:hypothetical protein
LFFLFFFFFFFFFFFSSLFFCLAFKVANGGRILVSRRGRDGNFVQFAKKILGSGVDQDGDHCRTYVDETGKFSFHVLVNQGLTFLCFSKNDLEKGVCFDFLYDLAAAFVENYAASLDDQDTEVFRDFEATMSDLMQEHGQPKGQALAGRYDSLKNKQFCGFRDSNGTIVAVTETQVDVTVFGVCVKVVCTKKYRNKTDAAQELFFTFKLDGATVCGFETSRGKESVVRAESDEWRTDPAFVVRELTRGGRAAFLLDEVGETETVNVLVGTLQPGEKLRATITYSTQLEMSGSLFELFLPLTRSWCDTSDAVFSLTVQLHMGSEIVGVACESGHEIEFEKTGVTGVVTVDSENILRVNAELLLYVTVASPHTPQLAIERGTGPGSPVTICVGWNPLFRSNLAEDTPSEFVFIADRSRALQGRKMGRLRSALMLWLHSLPTGCSFNIYAFAPEAIVQLRDLFYLLLLLLFQLTNEKKKKKKKKGCLPCLKFILMLLFDSRPNTLQIWRHRQPQLLLELHWPLLLLVRLRCQCLEGERGKCLFCLQMKQDVTIVQR